MKKVDIPMVERKDNSKSDIDRLIDSANFYLGNNSDNSNKKDNSNNFSDTLFGEFPRTVKDVNINEFYNQISKRNLTKEDLKYIYDIYNIRWLCDMYSKYDYDTNLYHKVINTVMTDYTGLWLYDSTDKDARNNINAIDYRIFTFSVHKKYLATIFDCSVSEITNERLELDSNPERYVCFLGDLDIRGRDHVYYPKLKYISGGIYSNSLEESHGLESLRYIGSSAIFGNLMNLDGLYNLKAVGGDLKIFDAKSANDLLSLESVKGDLIFPKLESSNGLESLKYIGGDANFSNLRDSSGLLNLRMIRGIGYFNSIDVVNNLSNLKYVGNGVMINGNEVKTKVRTKTK